MTTYLSPDRPKAGEHVPPAPPLPASIVYDDDGDDCHHLGDADPVATLRAAQHTYSGLCAPSPYTTAAEEDLAARLALAEADRDRWAARVKALEAKLDAIRHVVGGGQ